MKLLKILIFTSIFLFSAKIQAQNFFQKGKLYRMGDTVSGFIKEQSAGYRNFVYFKRFESAAETKYTPGQVLGFQIGDSLAYDFKTLAGKAMFARKLVDGKLKLYADNRDFYLQVDEQAPFRLSNDKSYYNDKTYSLSELFASLSANCFTSNIALNEDELVSAVREANKCLNSPCRVFTKKIVKKSWLDKSIIDARRNWEIGLNISGTMQFSHELTYSYSTTTLTNGVTPKKQLNPGIGLYFSLRMSENYKNVFQAEINIAKRNFQADFSVDRIYPDAQIVNKAVLEHYVVRLPLLYRRYISYPDQKVNFFCTVGLMYEKEIEKQNIIYVSRELAYSNGKTLINEISTIDYPTSNILALIGGGAKIKISEARKLTIEARYEYGKDFTQASISTAINF